MSLEQKAFKAKSEKQFNSIMSRPLTDANIKAALQIIQELENKTFYVTEGNFIEQLVNKILQNKSLSTGLQNTLKVILERLASKIKTAKNPDNIARYQQLMNRCEDALKNAKPNISPHQKKQMLQEKFAVIMQKPNLSAQDILAIQAHIDEARLMGAMQMEEIFLKELCEKLLNYSTLSAEKIGMLRKSIARLRVKKQAILADKFEKMLKVKLSKIELPKFRFTQTEAYLSIAELRLAINKWFGTEPITNEDKIKYKKSYEVYKSMHGFLQKYKWLIDLCKQREKEYANYYVFYQSSEVVWAIYQDFLKNLYQLEKKVVINEPFIFLRDYNSDRWKGLPDINTFLDKAIKDQKSIRDKGKEWTLSEYYPPINKGFLLSTNLSLFGSTNRPNSSTIKYFFKELSSQSISIGVFMANFLSDWIKDPAALAHLTSVFTLLAEEVNTKEGLLYQVFIPRNIVDQVAFLSFPRANPWNIFVGAQESWDPILKRYTKISPILDMYRNNPEKISEYMDGMEARIIPRNEVFANPLSGIKIFRYSMLNKEKEKAYQLHLLLVTKYIYETYIKSGVKIKAR